MRHQRYCLTQHPGIFSSITNATTPFNTPATPNKLALRPLYPRWCTTHATQAVTSPQHATHITDSSISPTLAHHPRQHANDTNTPPTLARLPRKHATHSTYNNTNSMLFLKLLGIQLSIESFQISNSKRKFSRFYFNFCFYSFYFLGLFKHF